MRPLSFRSSPLPVPTPRGSQLTTPVESRPPTPLRPLTSCLPTTEYLPAPVRQVVRPCHKCHVTEGSTPLGDEPEDLFETVHDLPPPRLRSRTRGRTVVTVQSVQDSRPDRRGDADRWSCPVNPLGSHIWEVRQSRLVVQVSGGEGQRVRRVEMPFSPAATGRGA